MRVETGEVVTVERGMKVRDAIRRGLVPLTDEEAKLVSVMSAEERIEFGRLKLAKLRKLARDEACQRARRQANAAKRARREARQRQKAARKRGR